MISVISMRFVLLDKNILSSYFQLLMRELLYKPLLQLQRMFQLKSQVSTLYNVRENKEEDTCVIKIRCHLPLIHKPTAGVTSGQGTAMYFCFFSINLQFPKFLTWRWGTVCAVLQDQLSGVLISCMDPYIGMCGGQNPPFHALLVAP